MIYGKYRFCGIFQDDAVLPEYKGSTFRGVFGHAIKKVVCTLKKQECGDCLLKDQCIYFFVFETSADNTSTNGKKRIVAPPHPYVIEPPETSLTRFKKGDPFQFHLILFGRANDYLPYFIYAMDQMGKDGIGKSINGNRGTFDLLTVSVGDAIIYTKEEGEIKKIASAAPTDMVVNATNIGAGSKVVEINLITPLRLKYENHLEATLPFHILTRAMLRRISSLCNHHGEGEPPLDYRGLVKRAEEVVAITSSLRWADWKRYSNRQEQAMLMGGMIGHVTYRGRLDEFLPLLEFCEKVHLGKQSSFGLGKIKIMEIK